jgi:hypothetical protein
MKKMFIAVFALLVASTAFAQLASLDEPANPFETGKAIFTWTSTTHDFGKILKDAPVSHEFTFTNSGDATLVISSVQAACGCTVTEYTKTPIAPGGTGLVKATYNAAKVGAFTKTVSVMANADDGEVIKLTIKGEVVEPVQ